MDQDRAAQQTDDAVLEEIRRRLRLEARERGDFARVHACVSSSELADETQTRLVIVDPAFPHSGKSTDSEAVRTASECLESRGSSPRLMRNTLAFLAPDRTRLEDLNKAVRDLLAWESIEREADPLNLDTFQRKQTEDKRKEADTTVSQRIPETYFWLLVPSEKKPGDDSKAKVEWTTDLKATGQERLALKASRKLKNDELLITTWAGSLLRRELDRVPLWRGNHVSVRQLAEDFAKYLYLPRLRDSEVLAEAIKDGVALLSWSQDSFAYADSFDDAASRYVGLKYARRVSVAPDSTGLLVRPDVARVQTEADSKAETTGTTTGESPSSTNGDTRTGEPGAGPKEHADEKALLRRFHGTTILNPIRLSRDAGQIADEVVQHLTKLPGATVEVTIEVQAQIPAGAPDDVVRTISENCRTLKFKNFDFEEE